MILYNLCWWISNALSDFKSVLIQRIIFCVVSVSLVITFYTQFKIVKVEYLIIAQLVGYTVSSLASILFVRAIQLSPKYFSRKHQDFFFSYGKFTSGSMIMGSLFRNADIFMIASFLNQGAVAVYSVAQKMVEIFEVALRGMASHALPEFCQCTDNYHLMMKKYVRTTALLLAMFLPAALLVFIFSESVIQVFSGAGYAGASIILKFFMIYVLFLVLDRMTGIVLEAFGLAKYNLIKTGLLLVINIVGNAIALLYFNSLAGVAAVSIVAAIFSIAIGFYFIRRQTGAALMQKLLLSGVNSLLE
jgi:O-antigen/teichoic acid export membrane protein